MHFIHHLSMVPGLFNMKSAPMVLYNFDGFAQTRLVLWIIDYTSFYYAALQTPHWVQMEERQPEVPDQYEQTWEKAVRWRQRTLFCSSELRSNLFKSKVMKKLIIFNEELAIHRTKKDYQSSSKEMERLSDWCLQLII